MRTGLRRHPKVVRMASALKGDRHRIVGCLHAVWSVFDEHSPDGFLEGYTLASMDDEVGWRGFSAAMQAIGWLIESEDGLHAPDYEEHNGPTAKRRATDSKRKERDRAEDPGAHESWTDVRKKAPTTSGQMSASDADSLRTRVELDKRNTPIAPKGADGRFERFWQAYPAKVGKDAARRAFDKRKPDEAMLLRMLAAIAEQADSDKWRKDGGQFIPNPATWLNQGRWQDEIATAAQRDDVFAGSI